MTGLPPDSPAPYADLAALAASLDLPGQATPFAVVDLDIMERNLGRMARYFRDRPANLRPHFKHHKCTEIARMQIDAGAVGITCQTSDEVAAAVRAGIDDVLMANVVTDRTRLASLAHSATRARVTVAVDSAATADMASEAALREGVVLSVVIEYDIGMHRSGVESIAEAVALAAHVATLRGVTFRGVMAYEGHLVKVADRPARTAGVLEAFAPMPALLDALREHGFDVQMFTGGASSTYDSAGNLPFMTDVEAGSYVLMDAAYVQLVPEFDPALAVIGTVATSRPGRPVVVDVGSKRIGSEAGTPVLAGFRATHHATSEEHNRFLVEGSPLPGVGDHVAVVPGHTCSTVALYRTLVGCRGGRYERLLEIDGRDPLA
jgi:D-serine deaminase-like pyridoxal phosphate-dependent protein